MKKIIYISALMFGALAFASCTKDMVEKESTGTAVKGFSLVASLDGITKTNASADGKVTWGAGDSLTVFCSAKGASTYGNNMKFSYVRNTEGTFTTATAPVLAEETTYSWYAIYPYSDKYTTPANSSTYTKVGNQAQTQVQTNSMTNIDGESLPLIGYAETTGTAFPVIEMHQAASLLKFNVTNPGTEAIKVSKISFTTAATKIVGTFFIDFSDVNNPKYVSSGEQYTYKSALLTVNNGTINAGETGAFYIVVCPGTLPAGADNEIVLTMADGNTCTRTWTPSAAATLAPGKFKNVNITYSKDAVSGDGAALPFVDDFSWVKNNSTSDGSTKYTVPSAEEVGASGYFDFTNAYPAANGGALKLGASGAPGSITTEALDLSSAFTVLVDIKKYGSDAGKVTISVDGSELKSVVPASNSEYETIFAYSSTGFTSSSKVVIGTSSKRAYIDNVKILSGAHAPSASLTVTTTEVAASDATSEDGTTAVVKGTYQAHNTSEGDVVTVGFEYKTGTSNWTSVSATSADSFTTTLTGLTASTQYSVRAWASFDGGTTKTYGEVRSFTTVATSDDGGGAGAGKTITWTATSGGLGTATPYTFKDDEDNSWTITRSKVVYTGWTSNCIQLGSGSGAEVVNIATSAITGTIKSVAVECSSYNAAHKVTISVGGNDYVTAQATAKWQTVDTVKGTGSSSGAINIKFENGNRALYIKSITVVVE